MTTILAVRRGNEVVVAGDGQVSVGQTVMKGTARRCPGPPTAPDRADRATRHLGGWYQAVRSERGVLIHIFSL